MHEDFLSLNRCFLNYDSQSTFNCSFIFYHHYFQWSGEVGGRYSTGSKKNIFYGTLGFAGLYGVVNGNYERIFVRKKTGFFKNYLFRVGGGYHAEWVGEGALVVAGISGMTGLNKNHLEIHLRVAHLWDY